MRLPDADPAAQRPGRARRRARAGTVVLDALRLLGCSCRPPRGLVVVSVGAGSCAGCPVRVRNTSSRLGSRSPSSAATMPSSSSRRTTAASMAGSVAAAATRPVSWWTSGTRPGDLGHDGGDRRGRARGRPRGPPSVWPPVLAFSSAGVPLRHHQAVVDDHDLVGQLVGLVQVLGGQQHGGAVGHHAAGWSPRPGCGPAGPARWSARPGTAPPGSPSRLAARSSRRRMPPE